MQSIRTLPSVATALAGLLAVAPAAFAQDAGAQDTGNGNTVASGKHFTVVGGVAVQKTTGNSTITGQRADFDSEVAPTLSASYNINDNIAIEAWGAGRSGHRVRTADGKVGSVDSQPVAVSGQYHFGSAQSTVRPFVGLGYFQSNINHETTEPSGALAGQRLGMSTPKGPMATVGVDLNLTPTWFARADARYLHGDSDVAVDGTNVGHANLDPVMVGVGIGAHF